MVLSERLPPEQALTAVDGWGGDAYAAYERDGVSCVTINYRGDTPEDLAQMQTALQAWVAKRPQGAGQRASSRTADPGLRVLRPGQGRRQGGHPGSRWTRSPSRSAAPTSRWSWSRAAATSRSPAARADRLVREFTIAQLNNPHLDQDRVIRTIAPCRKLP